MATPDSDSDEEVIIFPQASMYLEGFQFQPKKDDHDYDSSTGDGEGASKLQATDVVTESGGNRLSNIQWCTCNHCDLSTIKTERECVCCREEKAAKPHVRSNIEDELCMTNNTDFQVLCLNPAVLRNVLICLNNVRRDAWHVDPPSNKSFRWAAYRQVVWWLHGKLGRRIRRVIPTCAVNIIRTTFPKEDNEEYEGYHSAFENDAD